MFTTRSRSIIFGLVIAFVLAATLFAITSLAASNKEELDRFNKERQLSCVDDNELRASEIRLWEGVIAISTPPPNETPAQKEARERRVAQFRALLNEVFAPKDCGVAPSE